MKKNDLFFPTGINMGEYMRIYNLDKKEYVAVVPYKFWEYMSGQHSKVLFWLVTHKHNQRGMGWGDVDKYETLGRWAGDRIIVCGDYDPYCGNLDRDPEFKDITCDVLMEIIEYAVREDIPKLAEYLIESAEIECTNEKLRVRGTKDVKYYKECLEELKKILGDKKLRRYEARIRPDTVITAEGCISDKPL